MNVQSIIYANDHIDRLSSEAAKDRMLAALPRITLRQRLAALLASVRSAFADPIVAPGSVVPAVH